MRDHRAVLRVITDIAGTSGTLVSGTRDYPNQTYYDKTVMRKIEAGDLPAFLKSDEDRFQRKLEWYEDRDQEFTMKPYKTYRLQCFLNELGGVLFMSEQAVRDRLEELRNAENPVTATDGSKGQWRAANTAKIRALEWLLEEGENDD